MKNIWKVLDDPTQVVNNILQWHTGKYANWYQEAHSICLDLSDKYNTPLDVVVGIVAVLSPQLDWEWNIPAAISVLSGHGPSRALGANMQKAKRMLQTNAVFPHLSGQKVECFYENILRPLDNTVVTLDRWAVRAAIDNLTWSNGLTPKRHALLTAAYREAAKITGLLPHEIQADVWQYFRLEYTSHKEIASDKV